MMAAMREFASHYDRLRKELEKAEKGGAIQMARAYVVLYQMVQQIEGDGNKGIVGLMEPLLSEGSDKKPMGLFALYKNVKVPAVFEQEGVPNVPLAEGFRVQLSERFFASIKPGQQDAAFEWLRTMNHASLIKPTVNSSALSSALSGLREEKNIEPPDDVFNVAMKPGTSVVSTKK